MAHIRKLPSGNWNAVVRHPSGKKISRTDPLRRAVAAWAQETETAIRSGALRSAPSRRLTVGDWHGQWVKVRNVDANTLRKERSVFEVHILPRWKDWPLGSITRADVQEWITDLTRSGLAGSYIGTIYRTMVKLLGDAVEDGKLASSPCRRITLPREIKPTPRWLTREEYDRIILSFDGQPHAAVWRALIAVGCFTGMRPGELEGLNIGEIDFERLLIRVERVMTPKGMREYPKTDDSRRSVPFPEEVGSLLWAATADRGADDAAFPNRRGGRIWHSNWAVDIWKPALARAGVRYVRPYVLRHTAASWLVQAGVPAQEIAKLLGHAGMKLVSTYAHLAPDAHDGIRAVWAANAGGPQAAHAPLQVSGLDDISAGQTP